ncbi:MAG: deoxynucleoside kinase [Deltaproteobacteria bacterium]|nr:deoxynucleoside kinase [Deltaproteobacteria bacterium]
MENLRIGIVGNIGVGKSTLVKAASSEPYKNILLETLPGRSISDNVSVFEEEFNPEVLDAFYKDPISNAFMAQIEFFNGRLDRQKKIQHCHGIVLEDRTLSEDYYIFGLAQKILGNMSDEEFLAYQRTFELMTEKIGEPDLIIYLKADVETLKNRLSERGRESEKSIPEGYLKLLNELYEKFIDRHVNCPVITIDATENLPLEIYLDKTVRKIGDGIRDLNLRITTPGISDWVTLPLTKATLKAIDAETSLESYLRENPTLITIAGNVGLGKSTLTALMERSLKLEGLYESPEKNPLLEKFLGDKPQYCFDLQMHFLKMRAEMQIRGHDEKMSYVMDRSLPEDLLVFCYQFRQDGHLTQNQLDLLTSEFKRACDQIPSSDLMIVLKGPSELAWDRITQRGRLMEMEGGWVKSEIESLNKWYETYGANVVDYGYHRGKVLELDVNILDFTNRIHVGYIFDLILKTLKN